MAPAPDDDTCKGTITVLLKALSDKEESVNSSIVKSLNKIAVVHPNNVVDAFCELYNGSQNISDHHLANIIKVLEHTCVNAVRSLRAGSCAELVGCMLRAMTQAAEHAPAVQLGASAVLVAVGHQHYDMVLRSLINDISGATVPHYTVPHSLGTLAALNTQATVPHIKEILSKLIPLLPLVKAEAVKQAFSYAFGHFAVAVSEQIGDNVENDNIISIKENFVVEFSVIFDVLFNQWLHSHQPKVTESVLEALGPITRLISERKFNDTVNKFVTTLLSMYRRSTVNSYMISQCISYLLSPSPLNPKLSLTDHVLNSISQTLFQLVLLEPDYDQPQSVKNHFEVLRCFDHMAEQFPEMTIENLLIHCKNNQEKERIKSVIVLTHLTTSSQIFVDKYSAKFVNILKFMIAHEQSLRMKKVLVKAIVGLVYRNCVANDDDFAMVEFIIKHCSFEGSTAVDESDIDDLQDTCRSSLYLLSNTVTNVKNQLCNLLLKSLLVDDYRGSVTTVTQCLNNLLPNLSEPTEELTEHSMDNKIPAELIFVRCLIYLIDLKNSERNKNIILFLECYSDSIHKNLNLSSNVEVQRLLKYVDQNESEAQWHGMLRDLLMSSIDCVNSNKWLESISMLLSQQILSTKQDPVVKGVSLQFLAILSCHMSSAAFVEKVLYVILHSIRTAQLVGCPYISKAVGIASRKYGEYVLNELDLIYRDIDSKRSNKFFNFISSKSSKTESEAHVIKVVLISCYGKVAKESMEEQVLARLGENVTTMINDILKTNPSFDLSFTSLNSLYEIAKALHPAPHHTVVLRNRWQLLNAVLEQLFNNNLDKRNVDLFPIIVKASKALTKLQKGILPEERNTILRLLFNSIFGELSLLRLQYEKGRNDAHNDFLAKTLNDSLNILNSLIQELVIQSTCLSMIDDLVSLLLEWLHHENDDIRAATSNVLHVVFETYIKNVKLNYETPSKFGQMGYLLGLLIPKTTDTNFAVRLSTMDNIKLVIQIEDLYDGHIIEADDPCMASLNAIHNSVLTNDLKMITEFSTKLAKTICEKIPQLQLVQFIESILECFEDQEYSSTGISAVLNETFKCKGSDLYQSIERIVGVILDTMERIASDRRLKLLGPLASLAHHHSNAVTAVLLGQPLPLKPCVAACWRHIARDCVLSAAVIDNFMRTMTSIQLFEDPYHITENHIAALQPLTLITALGEMLEEPSTSQLCSDKFSELFSVLYTTLTSYGGALPPAYTVPPHAKQERFGFVPNRDVVRLSPAKVTLHTFGSFLQRVNCQKVKEACAMYSSSDDQSEAWACPELAPLLAGMLCRDAASHLSRLVAAMAPYAKSNLPPQRRAAITLFAELLYYRCNDNPTLIQSVLATLSSGCVDSSPAVRVAVLRGLAGVAQLNVQYRAQYLAPALAAYSQAADMQHSGAASENIPLASMQGLCRLLSDLDSVDRECHRELLSVTQKIRPFMNTEEATLREHSIKLFGLVASKVDSSGMREQSVNLLPCFLLHLCDENSAVVRASKFTLKQIFSTLEAKRCNSFVHTHLVESGRLLHSEFLSALLKLLAQELPLQISLHVQNTVGYLGSPQDDIRGHAALMLGILYSELIASSSDVEIDHEVRADAHSRLVQLLRNSSAQVRKHAAAALASVCLATPNNSPNGNDSRKVETEEDFEETNKEVEETKDKVEENKEEIEETNEETKEEIEELKEEVEEM